ncbi:FecR domain-containing protein [Pedobacter sp. PLR]|uniref:FecR family protein n=1 Tax=Pedobacter sp. PLR TaxID=2994465 RepID=UPI002246055A|nr:FecR family protein [Pedobacter sp. PLR]MCX2454259.1 FecR domain-containing protein [Pedobacter sp. PLR]
MLEERFSYLFEQYFSKQGSPAETEELLRLIDSGNYDQQLKRIIDQHYYGFEPIQSPFSAEQENRILSAVLNAPSPAIELKTPGRRKLWTSISIAASIALCLGLGLYIQQRNTYDKGQELAASLIGPGSNKARLVLGTGEVILLDTLKNGTQNLEAGVQITKTKDGQLIYTINDFGSKNAGLINTIETPRGGQYQVRLPDGTAVWLNAASKLKYSNVFSTKKREVTLSGEAYFEVAHFANRPFLVHTSNQVVEVLGTHFNVNAYPDEENQVTTLLEGRIKTSSKEQDLILKPGEQATLDVHNDRLKRAAADLESVMAWKNGDFIFKDEDLASVMKKIERWYDVEVVFQDVDPKAVKLGGWVSRSKNISGLIKIIEPITGLKIRIDGRRVTVMK